MTNAYSYTIKGTVEICISMSVFKVVGLESSWRCGFCFGGAPLASSLGTTSASARLCAFQDEVGAMGKLPNTSLTCNVSVVHMFLLALFPPKYLISVQHLALHYSGQ